MTIEQFAAWRCPAVALYDISSGGTVGAARMFPAPDGTDTSGSTDVPDLVIVSGPLGNPAARARAIDFAAQQSASTLKIAVLHLPRASLDEEGQSQRSGLYRAFDGVFIVDPADCADLVRRLVRTIAVSQCGARAIGCDWNDVRSIVGGALDANPAGYGFGEGVGAERAMLAVSAAIGQMARGGLHLSAARGVCIAIVAAPTGLLGREITAVTGHIQSRLDASASITLHIEFDDMMDEGAMQVDVFAFRAAGRVPRQGVDASSACADPAACNGDPLYGLARRLVLRERQASIALVQRHLRIGYAHASRLLDAMEGDILSPKDGKGMRTLIADAANGPSAII
jgi:hypothetical protein